MDQDWPGREQWHDLMERRLQVAELCRQAEIDRARFRAALAVSREQDYLMLNLLQDFTSQSDAESATLLRNQLAILGHVSDRVRQLEDEDKKQVGELIAAERELCDIERRLYTADESSGRGSRNEGDLSSEHCNIDRELWPREEETSHSSGNLFAREPVGGDITAQPQKIVRYASAEVQSYLAKLEDMNLLREQLTDFEDCYAQLVLDCHFLRDFSLEESRKGREDFAEQYAGLAKRLKQADEMLADHLRKDTNIEHDLHFTPAYGLLGGEEYFSSGLLQGWRKSAAKASRFRASRSARKDALETPLLAQPVQWLDWSRPSRRGRGQRRNKSYWNAKKRDPCFNPFERDCLFSDADGNLSEPAVAQLDSLSDMPFCISLRYLKKIGKEREMSTDLTDSNLVDMRGGKVHGIIRKMAFRVKGTSITFRKDFFVTDMLDDLVDVVFGWSFMASEFKLLFDKASDMFSDGMTGIKDAISGFHTKVAKVASAVRRRASEFISRTPSPSPPYSLCDMLAPDFYL